MFTENAEAMNKVYNVAVGENFSVNYLFNLCKEYLQSDFEACYREPREGDIRNSLADISLAKELLGTSHNKISMGLRKQFNILKELYSQINKKFQYKIIF